MNFILLGKGGEILFSKDLFYLKLLSQYVEVQFTSSFFNQMTRGVRTATIKQSFRMESYSKVAHLNCKYISC